MTVDDRDETLRRPARHDDADDAAEVRAVREEYADEEAEAAEVEAGRRRLFDLESLLSD
ncbi:MAG: hypothetical protein L0I24_24005 [Pseudonocardia sp.]|nr:hypothetical protein [Pseudonocardia sp.]